MFTDLMVYDWWAMILGWAGDGSGEGVQRTLPQLQWVQELLAENDVKVLPRSTEQLGRCYGSRDFWETFKVMPIKSRI
jgi:hypothetical protein